MPALGDTWRVRDAALPHETLSEIADFSVAGPLLLQFDSPSDRDGTPAVDGKEGLHMKVVLTATLLSALSLGAADHALAQDPPDQPPPNAAVRRGERPAAPTVQDSESRRAPAAEERRGAVRAPERAVPAPSAGVDENARRRENRGAEEATRQRVLATSAPTNSVDEEEQRGERRGAVRRPPSGGGGPGGGQGATRDRAVPRSEAPRRDEPRRVFVYPDYYRYYNRYYDPWGYGGFGLGYFYYSPWGWNPSYYGPGSGYGYGYGPSYGGRYGYDMGTVKLKVKPRDAEVFVDGYYAGTVDDFDGMLQALKLESGGYKIEIRKPGFETLHFDVRVQPERNITFRGDMKPANP
jgi:hypothetical protein